MSNRFSTFSIPVSLAACICWGMLLPELRAQALGGVILGISKSMVYSQTNIAPPRVCDPGTLPYSFMSSAIAAGLVSLESVTVTTPWSDVLALPRTNFMGNTDMFATNVAKASFDGLDEDYPNGIYQGNVVFRFYDKTSNDTAETAVLLEGNLYQTNPAPMFINPSAAAPYLSEEGTLPVLATEDLVLAWKPFTNAVADDTVAVTVVDASSPTVLVFSLEIPATNPAPTATIPAGTLTNNAYLVHLSLDRQASLNNTVVQVDYFGMSFPVAIMARSGYQTTTQLPLKTTRAVRLRSVSKSGGVFRFGFRALANRAYAVQSSTNALNWNPCLTTNAVTTNVVIQQPATNSARFFRVISL